MPTTPPEANRLERTIEANLTSFGGLFATVREQSAGQSAVEERALFRALSRPEYTKRIEMWVSNGASGASVSRVQPADGADDGKFSLEVEFASPRYGQVMQGRLLIFKPAVVSRRDSLSLTASERKHPVVLDPEAFAETARIQLPIGFEVDELPEPVKLETPFGSYAARCEVKDGVLLFTRSFVIRSAMVPAGQYAQVRSFFEKILSAEQAPVVLVKK
jgi:hypothetical protein